MTSASWWGEETSNGSPDPKNIWRYLQRNPLCKHITFSGERLSTRLNRVAPKPEDITFASFVQEYRDSAALAWFSCSALLTSAKTTSSEFLTIVREGTSKIKIELRGEAVANIRKLEERTVDRAAIVPDVLATVLCAFYRHCGSFEVGLSDDDAEKLQNEPSGRSILMFTAADFVRVQIARPATTGQLASSNAAHYTLQEDAQGFHYGFSVNHPGPKVEYKLVVEDPDYKPDSSDLRVSSYLCFKHFTDSAHGGLNLAIKQDGPSEAIESSSHSGRFPTSVWWFNHHKCKGCATTSEKPCPDHHFDDGIIAQEWRDRSILPYVRARRKQLRLQPQFDYMALVATGILFDDDLLGLFLTFCIKSGTSTGTPPLSADDQVGEFMRDLRGRIGHVRFQMMENLATEIAAHRHQLLLSQQYRNREQSERTKELTSAVTKLTTGLQGIHAAEQQVRLLINPPQRAIFAAGFGCIEYFDDNQKGVSLRGIKWLSWHDLEHCKQIHDLAYTLWAVLEHVCGIRIETDREISCGELLVAAIANANVDPHRTLLEMLLLLGGMTLSEISSLSQRIASKSSTESDLQALQRLLTNYKEILHSPRRSMGNAAHRLPWLPLLFVIFSGADPESTVRISTDLFDERFSTLARGVEWVGELEKGQRRIEIPLPAPDYLELLTFFDDVIHNSKGTSFIETATLSGQAGLSVEVKFRDDVFKDVKNILSEMKDRFKKEVSPAHGGFTKPFRRWSEACQNARSCKLEENGITFAHDGPEAAPYETTISLTQRSLNYRTRRAK